MAKTSNLLEETLRELEHIKKQESDVAWVGSYDGEHAISWEAFKAVANIEYNAGYGGQEIACDLVVVFSDGSWLERSEYDGSEWWDHRRTPIKKATAKPFNKVTSNKILANSVFEMNDS